MYVAVALVFAVVGWVVTALWGAHQLGDQNFLSEDAATTLFTGGHLGLVLLVIIPLFLGLATYSRKTSSTSRRERRWSDSSP